MAFQAALEENRRALHLGLPKIFSEVLSVIAAEHLIEYMMLMTRATMMSTRKCGGEPHSSSFVLQRLQPPVQFFALKRQ